MGSGEWDHSFDPLLSILGESAGQQPMVEEGEGGGWRDGQGTDSGFHSAGEGGGVHSSSFPLGRGGSPTLERPGLWLLWL